MSLCSVLPYGRFRPTSFSFIDSILTCPGRTSLVLRNQCCLPLCSVPIQKHCSWSPVNLLPLSCLRMWPSHLFCRLLSSNGVHYFSFCLNYMWITCRNLQFLFICFVLSPWYFHHTAPNPYFKCLDSSNILFLWSTRFASIQRNTPNKWFLVESLYSESNSSSYFMTTFTVFGHQTFEVTKLFHSFQIEGHKRKVD